jgi:tetratricopeptide (TPR) repeat protein
MYRVLSIIVVLSLFCNASLFDFKKLWSFQNYYNNKEYKKALDVLDEYSKDTPIINYNRANTLYKLKEYKEAIKYYKKAHSKDVDELNRLFNIANCYFKLDELDNAIYVYKLILKFKDDKATKNNLELALKRKLKELKEAKEKKNKKEKKSKKNSNKRDNKNKKEKKKVNKKRKLTKKELLKLKKLQEKEKFKREIKKILNRSLKDKKVPVLMYKIKGVNSNTSNRLKPW